MTEALVPTATFALKTAVIVPKSLNGDGTIPVIKWLLTHLFVEAKPRSKVFLVVGFNLKRDVADLAFAATRAPFYEILDYFSFFAKLPHLNGTRMTEIEKLESLLGWNRE